MPLTHLLQVTFQTAHGQLLDVITAPIGQVDLSKYTLDTYLRIVTYKTAYYTFYLPVACGMLLAEITDDSAYKTAEPILIEMGQYFQVRTWVCLRVCTHTQNHTRTRTHTHTHLDTRPACTLFAGAHEHKHMPAFVHACVWI